MFYNYQKLIVIDCYTNSYSHVCFRSFFGQPRKYYSDPLKIGVNVSQYGFTVDWHHNKVYYCANKQILEHDMFSGQSKQVYTTVSECVDLAVDPSNR